MNVKLCKKMQKRAVTFTAAALFCLIILFAGIFSAFVRIHNTLGSRELSLPIIEKTSQGQARFSVLDYKKDFDTEFVFDEENKKAYTLLFLLPDDSCIILSLFDMLCEYAKI